MNKININLPPFVSHPSFKRWCEINQKGLHLLMSYLKACYLGSTPNAKSEDIDIEEEELCFFLEQNKELLN